MTNFSQSMTNGQFFAAVLAVSTADEAVQFYQDYLDYLRGEQELEPDQAALVAQANIGYALGEGMTDAQIRMWVEATPARHPIMGTMNPRPSFDELLQGGMRYARERTEQRRRRDLLEQGIATDDT